MSNKETNETLQATLRCANGVVRLLEALDAEREEVTKWKAKYIGARQSAYAEGLEEQAERVAKLEAALRDTNERLENIAEEHRYNNNQSIRKLIARIRDALGDDNQKGNAE